MPVCLALKLTLSIKWGSDSLKSCSRAELSCEDESRKNFLMGQERPPDAWNSIF